MFQKILCSVLLVASAVVMQAQLVSKKISLVKGQQVQSVTISNMSMSQEMMGQQMDVKSTSTATSLLEVKSVNDKQYVLTNTVQKIVGDFSAMGQEMHFDSEKPDDTEGQIGAALKGKVGVPQEVSIDRQGKITKYTDTSSTGDMMSNLMGGNFMVGMQHPFMSVIPDKAVKTGDSWTDSTGSLETAKTVNNYTLEKVSGNDLYISFTGTMAKSGTVTQQGMEVNMNLNGVSKGASVYDGSTGILKNNRTESKMTGTMEVMGQSVPITITITATTTVGKP